MKFLVITVRSSLCILTLILLSNTTPFSDLLDVLKRARVPALMVTTLALMYRYLFVLKDQSARMKSLARAGRLPRATANLDDPGNRARPTLRPLGRTSRTDLRGDVRAGWK